MDVGSGNDGGDAARRGGNKAGAGGEGGNGEDGGAVEAAGLRKTEEAEALASQLQIIAMHLVSLWLTLFFSDGGECGSGRGVEEADRRQL